MSPSLPTPPQKLREIAAPLNDQVARALEWVGVGLAAAGLGKNGKTPNLDLQQLANRLARMAPTGTGRPADIVRRLTGTAVTGSLLTRGLRVASDHRAGLATAATALAGLAAIGIIVRRRHQQADAGSRADAPVAGTVTINRPQGEVYRFWRTLENLPRFMDRIASVRVTGERTSHWVAKAPAGTTVEWDAEITEDVRDERIAWRSLDGADMDSAGVVRFEPAPAGRGTIVRVEMHYRPPGGAVGSLVARLFGQAPERQLRADLRRLAQLLEAGEIAGTAGQSSGRKAS